MADLGGEAGISFDAVLEGLGHLVERLGDEVEVGVAADGQSGVEAAAGDGLGRLAHVEERGEHPAARPEPDEATGEGGEGGGAEQRDGEAVEGALEVGERHALVVLGGE